MEWYPKIVCLAVGGQLVIDAWCYPVRTEEKYLISSPNDGYIDQISKTNNVVLSTWANCDCLCFWKHGAISFECSLDLFGGAVCGLNALFVSLLYGVYGAWKLTWYYS